MSMITSWLREHLADTKRIEKHLRALRLLEVDALGVEDPLEGDGIEAENEPAP